MLRFGTTLILFRLLGISFGSLATLSAVAQETREDNAHEKLAIKSVADLDQMLQLDMVEFDLQRDLVDWSSIDTKIAAEIVDRYLTQAAGEGDVMMSNAHQTASDPIRSNYEERSKEMNPWEKHRYELFLKEQAANQSLKLITAIDRTSRLKELVQAAMMQTAPILAAKGEFGLLFEHPETAVAALKKAAADESHKYRFESLLALKENWKDQTISPEIVQNITDSFAKSKFTQKLKILKIMIAFDDTPRAIEWLREELNSQPTSLPDTFNSNLDSSNRQGLRTQIDDLTKNLELGGTFRKGSSDRAQNEFRKWSPSEIFQAHLDRAELFIDLVHGQPADSDRWLELAEQDAAMAKQRSSLLPEEQFKAFNELRCLELQCQALGERLKNSSKGSAEKDRDGLAKRMESAYAEREELLRQLPEKNPRDKKQKQIRTAMTLVEKAKFASNIQQSKVVVDCHQKLVQLGDDYSEWGEFRIFRDAYLREQDLQGALRVVNNAMIKQSMGSSGYAEDGSDRVRVRRSERIQTAKQTLPDMAIYWDLAAQVGDDFDRRRCQEALTSLIDRLK